MRRRLDMLATVARLHDRRMRQRAAELLPLQERAAAIEAEKGELDRRRREESAVSLPEAMPYMGRFLAALRRENDRLAAERAAVWRAVEAKRDAILEAYQDLRSNEHLREAMLERLRRERLEAEQKEADERGVIAHARRRQVSRRPAPPG